MDINKAMEMAKEAGFDTVATIDPGKMEFRSEVRDMCAACPGYGLSWGCPPACGTLEEVAARVKPYTSGILVQTICKMEDEYDMAAWGVAGGEHGTRFMELLARFQEITDVYPMGAGGCRRCEEGCSYPDAPCRHPELVFPSMEASGLLVSDVCRDNGVTYYYGPNTVAFNCCYLFKPED